MKNSAIGQLSLCQSVSFVPWLAAQLGEYRVGDEEAPQEFPQQLPSAKTEVDVIAAFLERPLVSHPLVAKEGLGAGLNELG